MLARAGQGNFVVKVTYITPDGQSVLVNAEPGESLMEAAVRNGVDGIVAACGGCLSCATCHAYVDEPWLSKLAPQSEVEREMLDYASHVQASSRLTCQIEISEDMEGAVIRTPPSQD